MKTPIRLVVFALYLSSLPLTASEKWPKEPDAFRGVPFGASIRDAAAKLGFASPGMEQDANGVSLHACGHMKDFLDGKVWRCRVSFRIADVDARQQLYFDDDKLVSVSVAFPSDSFSRVREILIERYGDPSSVKHEPLRTKAGVDYSNEEDLWSGDAVTLRLIRYEGTVDDSTFTLADRRWSAKVETDDEALKKKAAAAF